VLSPAAALALARLPLLPVEFALGLGLFWAMPTSASAGVMMVSAAGGAVPLAVALTVVSNIVGVFTAPAWVALLLGAVVPVNVPALLASLAETVLLPLAVGWALREFVPVVKPLVARHRVSLRMMQAVCLSVVPWQLMAGNAAALAALDAATIAALCAAVILSHCALFAANIAAAATLPAAVVGGATATRVAVAIMGAQKTLLLAAAIVVALPPSAGLSPGLLMLPSVLGHLAQTVLDSVAATQWHRRCARAAATSKERGRAGACWPRSSSSAAIFAAPQQTWICARKSDG